MGVTLLNNLMPHPVNYRLGNNLPHDFRAAADGGADPGLPKQLVLFG